ncbi:hypothetical protein [Kribbella solani]|uniref:Uncharacterized protein n=1 Tax=Kribbella solani TaxID=236067 RepID=A0A841DPQ7_9ACTN|nr:hypothetical protein [Kribbella solani]MBB5979819.1 hypothetical protein [Kribbella solani]
MADEKPTDQPGQESVEPTGATVERVGMTAGGPPDIRGLDDQEGVPEVSPGTEIEKDGPPDF